MASIKGLAATGPGKELEPFEYDPGDLGRGEVEIAVSHCGICHSDLSMLNNDWGFSNYPLIAGHEVVGTIAGIGEGASRFKIGERVGLGWFSRSCNTCPQCMRGDHNLCATAEMTIVGRHGGFANRVRCHETWATRVPDSLDPAKAGPLFCGGITVFGPIVENKVSPMDRVGVIGIGGLGHMAVRFLRAWGCEVTAFTSSESKFDEARQLGAHRVVNSRDASALEKEAGKFDFILSTVNVSLDWAKYFAALAPRGRFHTVGAVDKPIEVAAFDLIMGQKSLSGSPLGSPAIVDRMLEFCSRHKIEPVTEFYPMSKINDALEHLKAGKARYRIVLENDL